MDFNDYASLWLVKQRHAELLEAARRHALLGRARPETGWLRVALGTTLIRLGAWLLRRQYAT
jgi:hypothetical protein